jgi:hypothetical protein
VYANCDEIGMEPMPSVTNQMTLQQLKGWDE